MSYYQYDLKTKVGFDTVYLTCWLDYERKLTKGERVELKDYPHRTVWTVESVGSEQRQSPPNKSWKVGGLDNDRRPNKANRVRSDSVSDRPLHSDVRCGESGVQDSGGDHSNTVVTGSAGCVQTPDS